MTRCGHVYCWPCILHYLSLSDKIWRKCPICYESIHRSDLKSVVEITQTSMNIGDRVRLRLMRRERGSLVATSLPETENLAPTNFFYVTDDSHCRVYSKLLLATPNDLKLYLLDMELTKITKGYVSLRTVKLTFGDALAQALEQSSLEPTPEKSEEAVTGGGKKRKKKNKPTVLFATGMARST